MKVYSDSIIESFQTTTAQKATSHHCVRSYGECRPGCWPDCAGWTHPLRCPLHAEQETKGDVEKHSNTHIIL